jgi:hypothetical protein
MKIILYIYILYIYIILLYQSTVSEEAFLACLRHLKARKYPIPSRERNPKDQSEAV